MPTFKCFVSDAQTDTFEDEDDARSWMAYHGCEETGDSATTDDGERAFWVQKGRTLDDYPGGEEPHIETIEG